MSKDKKQPDVYCNFCGKSTNDVGFVIKGTAIRNPVFICQLCNQTCAEIFETKNIKDGVAKPKIKKINFAKKTLYPKNVKQFLDQDVIGQEQAKAALSIAVANHYKRLFSTGTGLSNDLKSVKIDKTNVLLIGPTGSGKTLLVKSLAKFLNVPFSIGDATCLTEAGYVGEDVESIVSALLRNADYDVAKAQMGIIYIDEIDKIAKSQGNVSVGRDVSGEGVQQGLLKIIEGTVCNIAPQGGRKHPEQKFIQVDTSNILFICGGTFVGIEEIVAKRCGKQRMGFGTFTDEEKSQRILPEDLVEFGMIPEFVGRFPLMQNLERLEIPDLLKVLTDTPNCLVNQYKKIYALDQVDLSFEDEALSAIAKQAYKLETGARALSQILETVLFDYNFKIDEFSGQKLLITGEYVKKVLGENAN